MSLDSRIRDELRAVTSSHDLDEDAALRAVKDRAARANVNVVPLEDGNEPRRPLARSQRLVGALAAAALIAGAIAVPFALRDRSRETATPSEAAGGSGTRYRSTVVIRVDEAPTVEPTPTTKPSRIELTDAGRLAMTSAIRKGALSRSDLDADDPRVSFGASIAGGSDELSLTVTAPTGPQATALARDWATVLTKARIAEAKTQIRAQQHALAVQVRALHEQLRSVDHQLATLLPDEYGDVERFDSPSPRFPGREQGGPPPVPENGTPKALNLAFERIQILEKLDVLSNQAATLRISVVKPDVYATVVSQSRAVRIESDESNTSTGLIAGGLLLAGVVLAGTALLLGRRSRRRQAS